MNETLSKIIINYQTMLEIVSPIFVTNKYSFHIDLHSSHYNYYYNY